METNLQPRKGHTYLQWTFTLIANITILVQGIENGWVSPIEKYLQSDRSPTGYPISDKSMNWIVSSMSLAATFSVPIYTFLVDTFGRRLGLIFVALPQVISWIIRLSYSSTTSLIMARVLAGMACGGCYNVVPIYVKEISQDNIRGTLGSMSTLCQTLGVLIIYIFGAYLDYFMVNCIVLCLPILSILLMLKAPESPAYLVKRDKINEAANNVAFLRGLQKDDKIVQSIVEEIKKEDDYFKSLPNITVLNILRQKSWRKAFILSMVTFTFFELNGTLVIITYASTILSSTGVQFNIRPEIQVFSFPVMMIIGSLMVALLVDRVGRKPLLITAFFFSACSMFSVPVMMFINMQGGTVPLWLPVLIMMICVFMYSGGVLPLSYIIMTEMFNFRIRAKLMGIVVTYAWFLTFWLLNIHSLLSTNLGNHSAFLFYGIVNLSGAIFTMICLPETKGKSEEQILKILVKDKNTRNDDSGTCNPQ